MKMKYKASSLYIHIPFCKHICTYCDFIKVIYNKNRIDNYFKSLFFEFDSLNLNNCLKTIFIGGGTPSCIDLDLLEQLLIRCNKALNTKNKYEFTIECNVEDISIPLLTLLKKYNVNRLSMGVQTFNEKYIKAFNRHHNKEMVYKNVNLANKYFNNISIDMIYGMFNQTQEELIDDIIFACSLPIKHISYYSLQLEENTVLYAKHTEEMDDGLQANMYKVINDLLRKAGFHRYEISNFSKKGYQSMHNLVYWHNNHYYAIGVGAAGYLDNIRFTNTKSIKQYCENNNIKDEVCLTKDDQMFEQIMLNLRLDEGLNINTFNKHFSCDFNSLYSEQIKKLLDNKLIKCNKNKIKTTFKGSLLLDDILIEF